MNEGGHKTFDAYADDYDVALARGISVSGERKDYFAQRRIEWLRDCLKPFFSSGHNAHGFRLRHRFKLAIIF